MNSENNILGNETNNSSFILVRADNLAELCDEVKKLRGELSKITATPINRIYLNKDVKEILGVQDKLLKKYRDEGMLSYSQVGDKYWYTQSDIDQFLERNYFAAYGTPNNRA